MLYFNGSLSVWNNHANNSFSILNPHIASDWWRPRYHIEADSLPVMQSESWNVKKLMHSFSHSGSSPAFAPVKTHRSYVGLAMTQWIPSTKLICGSINITMTPSRNSGHAHNVHTHRPLAGTLTTELLYRWHSPSRPPSPTHILTCAVVKI